MCLWQQTSANPIKPQLPLMHAHTCSSLHSQTPPSLHYHLSRDQAGGLGKRWPPFGPLSCPLHPAQGGDGRKLVSPSSSPPLACVPVLQHQSCLRTWRRPKLNTGKCTGKNVPVENETNMKNNEIKLN